jgi:peptidase E
MTDMKPLFLLAGGGPQRPEKEALFIARALNECGCAEPKVAYIGTASSDSVLFFKFMKAVLQKAGAADIKMVKLAKAKTDLSAARKTLEAADMIFLSGGEVYDGMVWLVRHDMVGYMHELRQQGKVFLGVSAGAIMMGSKWVRWEDEKDDSTASLFDCLNFIPTTFDTHAEDEDWKELKTALRLQGHCSRGYGIHRGGMVVAGDGGLEAAGEPLLCYVNNNGQVELFN